MNKKGNYALDVAIFIVGLILIFIGISECSLKHSCFWWWFFGIVAIILAIILFLYKYR